MILAIAALLFNSHVAIENARADYNALPDFICHEQMQRYHNGKRHDVIDATLRFSAGREVYSGILHKGKRVSSMRKIGDPWSYGEYGGLLKAALAAMASRSDIASHVNPDGTIALEYFTTRERSDWEIVRESGDTIRVSFSTRIILSPDHRIKSVSQISYDTEPGVLQYEMAVETAPHDVGGNSYLLPSAAHFQIIYAEADVYRNEIQFDSYRKFQVESKLIVQTDR